MNGISLFTKTTGVISFVCTLAFSLGMSDAVADLQAGGARTGSTQTGGAPAQPQVPVVYQGVDPRAEEEVRNRRIEKVCTLEATTNGQLDVEAKNRCKLQLERDALRGTAGGSDNRCSDASTRFDTAYNKYTEACSVSGVSSTDEAAEGSPLPRRPAARDQAAKSNPPARTQASQRDKIACIKAANDCANADKAALAAFETPDEDESQEDAADRVKNACTKLYGNCPLRAAVDKSKQEKTRKEAREEEAEAREKFVELQEDVNDVQKNAMESQTALMKIQTDSAASQTRARQRLESSLNAAEQEKAQKTQALREGFSKIDQQYVQLRKELEQTNAKLNLEADAITAECTVARDKLRQQMEKELAERKAMGRNSQRSAANLAGLNRQRNARLKAEYNICMADKPRRDRRARIEEQRTLALKSAMDIQVLLESQRQQMIQNMTEAEILAEAARNTAAKQLQEQMREQQTEQAQAHQSIMQEQQLKMQQGQQKSARLAEAESKLNEAQAKRKIADMHLECASKHSRSVAQTFTAEDSSKFETFLTAATLYNAADRLCQEARNQCKLSNPTFQCLTYGPAGGEPRAPATTPAAPASGTDGQQ